MKPLHKNQDQAGFSLLETSIALLVIALLATIVVVGEDIMHQARQRAVIGEVDKYTHAYRMFIDKYYEPPGDYSKAEAQWGADTVCPNILLSDLTSTAARMDTCDGNGDGKVAEPYEWYRAWQHLANAGMVEEGFTGVGDNVPGATLLENSIPPSQTPLAGYMIASSDFTADTADQFAHGGSNVIYFGSVDDACDGGSGLSDCMTNHPAITPAAALEIDQKLDDARPGLGKVIAYPASSSNTPDCATTSSSTTAAYDVDEDGIACALIIRIDY